VGISGTGYQWNVFVVVSNDGTSYDYGQMPFCSIITLFCTCLVFTYDKSCVLLLAVALPTNALCISFAMNIIAIMGVI